MKPPHTPPRWAAAEQTAAPGRWYIYNVTTRRVIAMGMAEQYAKEVVAEHNETFQPTTTAQP